MAEQNAKIRFVHASYPVFTGDARPSRPQANTCDDFMERTQRIIDEAERVKKWVDDPNGPRGPDVLKNY